ncbi:MAG TPA: hypothetical protein VF261_00445, partial [Candidatus Saccharimonadales bacterium]
MRYYTVWVRSQRYRGNAPLTYSCDRLLTTGQIVAVPLQREQVLGFVSAAVASKPAFVTKSIAKIYDLPPLPAQLLQLGAWLQRFYASTIGTVTQQL